jgi:DNA polymerase III subunit beta
MTATAILSRSEFRSALAIATKAIERRNTIPILSNVLLRATSGGLEIVGTDLDVTISATIPGATYDEGFAATLPAHALQDIEKKALASESMAIDAPEHDGDSAALDFEGLRVSMQSLAVADFPEQKIEGKINAEFDLSSADLAEALDRVQFAISTEETRYYLNGVYMHALGEELRFVTTDGHRLARVAIDLPEGAAAMPGIIVPRATVKILHGLAKAKNAPDRVRIKINSVKALFTFGNVDVLSKLVDGTFPDYSRVIPAMNDKRAKFNKAELVKAISGVSAISSERGRAVKFSMEDGRAVLSVDNPDMGRAEMVLAFDSVDSWALDIGFNARYVLDVLGQIDADAVCFAFNEAGSPTLISEPGNGRVLFVLMPMRV